MSFDYTVQLTKLAIDACELRQNALAANIAQSNAPDYQQVDVDFEQQLQRLDIASEASLEGIKPQIMPASQRQSTELLMAQSMQNMTHYRSLIRGMNQQFSLMKIALRGNNER